MRCTCCVLLSCCRCLRSTLHVSAPSIHLGSHSARTVQDKTYVYVSLGGRHQNTSLNTADARSPEWSDTLTFDHPSSEHRDLSVAIYSKHTLLPDTLIGSAGITCCQLHGIQLHLEICSALNSFLDCRLSSQPYHIRRTGQDHSL